MEIPLLNDIITIFVLSTAVIFVCHRLRVPGIVGFFLTGILAGPHGFGLVGAIHEVEVLAEIGVVLLLFAIGIEFSFNSLLEIKKTVFLGGPLQVLLTITASYFLARLWQRPLDESIFVGCLISLSSTAIVLKLLQEKAQVDSPHGRSTLGILIFQDIAVVPMMLIIPLLAGAGKGSGEPFYILAGKGLGIILLVIAGAKWIVPQVLYQIARTRNREIFLLTIIVICLVTAWITSKAGLSLALGAFLAGLVISESEYGHQALSNILPFRDIFTSFFFVSLGMLLDVSLLFRHPSWIFLLAFSVLILKSLLAGLTAILLGLPLRTSILIGLTLGQVGEFSFVLLKTGVEHGLFAENSYQIFLASSVLTLAATPFVFNLAPHLAGIILRLPIPARLLSGIYPMPKAKEVDLKHHIIIIGFGINGRNVARAASLAGISYVILEMNPETVKKEQAKVTSTFFYDGVRP